MGGEGLNALKSSHVTNDKKQSCDFSAQLSSDNSTGLHISISSVWTFGGCSVQFFFILINGVTWHYALSLSEFCFQVTSLRFGPPPRADADGLNLFPIVWKWLIVSSPCQHSCIEVWRSQSGSNTPLFHLKDSMSICDTQVVMERQIMVMWL